MRSWNGGRSTIDHAIILLEEIGDHSKSENRCALCFCGRHYFLPSLIGSHAEFSEIAGPRIGGSTPWYTWCSCLSCSIACRCRIARTCPPEYCILMEIWQVYHSCRPEQAARSRGWSDQSSLLGAWPSWSWRSHDCEASKSSFSFLICELIVDLASPGTQH